MGLFDDLLGNNKKKQEQKKGSVRYFAHIF